MKPSTRLVSRGIGIVLVAIAAWGGVVAFVGPSFDFTVGNAMRSWVWNQSHATLSFAPGLVGVVGGLLMLAALRPGMARLGALLALIAGTWFVIGPTLDPLWHRGGVDAAGTAGSTTMRVLEGIGYHYGTGIAIVLLSAFALGLLAITPEAVGVTEDVPRRLPGDASESATVEEPRRPRRLSRHHASHA